MSTINTNNIDVNYPIPGVNNSSQGFRDNFSAIKTNLNTAATEITDLQNKAVFKSALTGLSLNNDMANTLISNAAVRSFRNTTYNLGNSLSGTILIDASLGDVQYGNIVGNITLQFGSWAPTNTLSKLILQLGFSNNQSVVTFPSSCIIDSNHGASLLENFVNISNTATFTPANDVTQINLELTSTDCGNTIFVTPLNRPYQTTQIYTRTPPTTGFQGDVSGTTCVDSSLTQLAITNTYANDEILTANTTSQLYPDLPVVFTGNTFGGLTAGSTYYVHTVSSSNTFTITTTAGGSGSNVNLSAASGNCYANPIGHLYIATSNYNSTTIGPKVVTNTNTTLLPTSVAITGTSGQFSCSATSALLVVGQKIVVSGTLTGTGTITGYSNPSIYYIISTNGSTTFQLSTTRGGSGIVTTAGTTVGLTFTVSTNNITLNNTTSLMINAPVIFEGNIFGTTLQSEQVYYIKSINSPNITISMTRINGVAGTTLDLDTANGNCNVYSFNGSDIFKRIPLNPW